METIIRQSVGIDIAKLSFTACICQFYSERRLEFSEVVKFENTKNGFQQLTEWVQKKVTAQPQVHFVMESTGIYYEPLAYHLFKHHGFVSVVLPKTVKDYAEGINFKSKAEAKEACTIALMGVAKKLPFWRPPESILKDLRDLTRLYTDLNVQRTKVINRLISLQSVSEPLAFVVRSSQSIIDNLYNEIEKCGQEIKELINRHQWLADKVKKLQTIQGVGLMSIAIILGETQGFKLIRNSKQLTSYAGYDIVNENSGINIKGKAGISKKGNSRIRAALHFPALEVPRYNAAMNTFYTRINEKKENEMVAATAIQRKILILIYSLWKNDTVYQEKITSGTQ